MVFAENKVFFQQETYLLFFGMIEQIKAHKMEETNLERERLEFEKQKLEFEKQKFEHQKKNINSEASSALSLNALIIYISSAVLVISIFLPWVSSSGSGIGVSYEMSGNALGTGFAFYIIPLAIASALLVLLKKTKFASIPGALALLTAFSSLFGIGSVSYSGYGVSASAGLSFGPVVSALASITIIVASLIKETELGHSVSFKSIVLKYKKQLFFAFIVFSLIGYYVNYDLLGHIPLTDIFLVNVFAIIWFAGIQAWGAHKLGYKNLKVLYSSFMLFLVLNIIGEIHDYYTVGLAFINGYYVYFFIPFFIISILTDLEINNIIRDKLSPLIKRFTIKNVSIMLISPIAFFVLYHLVINRTIPEGDKNPFSKNHEILAGNWYFTDKDSSAVYFLDVKFNGFKSSNDRRFYLRSSHSLTDYFEPFSTNKMSGEYYFNAHRWDSLLIRNSNISLEPKKYDEPLVLPIKNEDLEIDFKDGQLIVSLLKDDIIARNAYKELKSPETQNLVTLVKKSIQRKIIAAQEAELAEQKANNKFDFEGVITDEIMGEYGTDITVNVTQGILTGQQIVLVFHDGNYCEECENYYNEGFKGYFAIGDDENIGRKVIGVYKEGKCYVEDHGIPDDYDDDGNPIFIEKDSVSSCYRPIQLNYN